MDDANEILKQAAEAAKVLLPSLITKRQELMNQSIALTAQIDALNAILRGVEGNTTVNFSQALLNLGKDIPSLTFSKAPRGQLEQCIDTVLQANPNLPTPEIRREITSRFPNVPCSSSSLYSNLQRGLDSGKYVQNGGRWSLSSTLPSA